MKKQETKYIVFFIVLIFSSKVKAQNKFELDGLLTASANYSPDNELELFSSIRYIPELNYSVPLDSNAVRNLDFLASVNIYGNTNFHPFDTADFNGDINPYRVWGRYTSNQFELRVGLQKIDFGVATVLRPLQWFNQIDPRDPLSLTNGVYGALTRYYFLNNANIWFWVLYGNEETRGFDALETNATIPEIGGRIQYPVPKGEIGISYHHRTSQSTGLDIVNEYEKIPENRIGIDGKWDVLVGLWFEFSHVNKAKDLGILTNQTLINVGTDYTFGIGSGLNVVLEHLVSSSDRYAFEYSNVGNISAATFSYPLSFFDNLSTVLYYNYSAEDFSFFLNYEHQFKKITGYVMAFYNPTAQLGIQENELINNFAGPGLRLMVVYNH